MRNTLIAPFNDQLNRNALQNGFFALEGARAKRDLVDAVIARHIAGTVHADVWKKLIARAGIAARQRNRLAHWRVSVYAGGRPGRRYALEEWVYPKKILKQHANGPKPGALCLRDIVSLRAEFMALMASIDNFRHRLAGREEPSRNISNRQSTRRRLARSANRYSPRSRAFSRNPRPRRHSDFRVGRASALVQLVHEISAQAPSGRRVDRAIENVAQLRGARVGGAQ